jgi:hypothetical protein
MLPCFSMYYPLALARLPKGKRARGSIPSQRAAIGLNPVAASPSRRYREATEWAGVPRYSSVRWARPTLPRARLKRTSGEQRLPKRQPAGNKPPKLPAPRSPQLRGATLLEQRACDLATCAWMYAWPRDAWRRLRICADALSARADLYFRDIGLSTARRLPWLTTNC